MFDCSRFTFQPWNDFLGVVIQQGRVFLDPDWNELVAQLTRRIQAGSLDTFGQAVVPRETPEGFHIEAKGGPPRELTIGPGRIYVDGLLAENHGQAHEKKWDWDTRLAELTGSDPVSFFKQPYLPFNSKEAPAGTPAADVNPPQFGDGPLLVYVDVWQREVTALQKPELVEKAVGVDTTGRLQTVWQVKVLENIGEATCNVKLEEWTELTRPSGARLTTSTGSVQAEPNPCLVPPSAGYQGLENQLYRVEVHHAGEVGKATFKWSRDNATVASRVVAIPTLTQVVVESVGRDEALAFHPGDWVEILDDWLELHGIPGILRRIQGGGVDSATRTLTLEAALPPGLFPVDIQGNTDAARHTRVRRWDQSGVVHRADGTVYHDLGASGISAGIPIPTAGTKLLLENGILVEFNLDSPGKFKTGDYWAFAARAVDGSIELLDRAPPRGIHHHYARLAIVTFPDDTHDCRTLWPPVVDGASCDCTVCVHPGTHNEGTATIQQAIDAVRNRGGGTVCLDVGTYRVDNPLQINGVNSIRIRGQGWGTFLLGASGGPRPSLLFVGASGGPIFEISNSVGVSLQNLTAISSATSSLRAEAVVPANNTAVIAVKNTVDFSLEHVNAFCIATGQPSASTALALSGYLIGANVRDCALVASNGIVAGVDEETYCLTAGLRITGNLLLCQDKGVSLEGWSLHYGDLRVSENLFLGCSDVGIDLTGGALPGSLVLVEKNTLNLSGSGIRSGLDGLRVSGNEIFRLGTATGEGFRMFASDISSLGTSTGDGIVIDGGFDPGRLDNLQIVGNRIQGIGGHGIAIRRLVGHGIIKSNFVEKAAGFGLIIEGQGRADYLSIESNHFLELGPDNPKDDEMYAAVLLLRVSHVDFVGNVLNSIARGAGAALWRAGVLTFGCGEVRISGNRLHNIGPGNFSGLTTGIQCLSPFRHVAIDDNTVVRDDTSIVPPPGWQALNIGFPNIQQFPTVWGHMLVPVNEDPQVLVLVSTSGVSTFPQELGRTSVHRNRFQASSTAMPLVYIATVETCLFTENYCRIMGAGEPPDIKPSVGQISGKYINASNNQLIGGNGNHTVLQMEPSPPNTGFVVLGNMRTGKIKVSNSDLDADWAKYNPIIVY